MENSNPIEIEKTSLIWLGELIQKYFTSYEKQELKEAALDNFKENLLKSKFETIDELSFSINTSYRQGSFGDLHPCIDEYKFLKCPLVVILAFIGYKELLNEILNKNKDKNLFLEKGQFAQFYSTKELKDSNLVVRFTFENFNFAHVWAIERFCFSVEEFKNFRNYLDEANNEKCGVFAAQHKSHLYGGFGSFDDERKYRKGHHAKIENCSSEEIKEIDKKVYKEAHHDDSDDSDEKRPKAKKAVVKKVVRKSKI